MAEEQQQHQPQISIPSKPYGFPPAAFDPSILPDGDTNFLPAEDLEAFIQALSAPEPQPLQSPADDGGGASSSFSLRSPSLRSFSSVALDITRRSNSVLPDEAQVVAAHAAAASGEPMGGQTSDSGNKQNGPGPSGCGADDGAQQQAPPPSHPHPASSSSSSLFITAQSDWAPVHEKVIGPHRHSSYSRRSAAAAAGSGGLAGAPSSSSSATTAAAAAAAAAGAGAGAVASSSSSRKQRRRSHRAAAPHRPGTRTRDETREGYLYGLLKWPFLLIVGAWIVGLAVTYVATRAYISIYEQLVAWRGRRERLRRNMRATSRYGDWVRAARELDEFLGNGAWKEQNEFAYYDSRTVRRVWEQLRRCRAKAEAEEKAGRDGEVVSEAGVDAGTGTGNGKKKAPAVEDLKVLIEACVKNNFVGVENPRLYSQTYYGTKNLVQNFVDEVEKSLKFLLETKQLNMEEKRVMFKRLNANYGRTALCLSGGGSFAYYHFGVIKALLEEDLLPDVITGTSGGALVAALVATRTNEELKQLLVPSLASKITACREPITTWVVRWWRTGARFDSVDWAKQCSWWTRGSMTFREAFERTGRVLNVSCVPADPHSPTILCNYLTSPDCVIWSAVLASAAVPGILNPVVLMMKNPDGTLSPYSFGHKWKDGSLRTDIPIRALNLHFNVNFTIVSQVNPHINLFFFSSRGSVGQPVTHRRGRGWRGGYLGSATEQYIKLDLTKWLRVLRQLELLPRPLGQDWSQLWLQQFGGTVTIWPKSVPSDFVYILSDPDPARLARMIHEGQQSAFPKVKFVSNRLRVERLVERGRRETRAVPARRGSIQSIISEEDLRGLLLLRSGGSSGGEEEDGDGVAPAIGGGSSVSGGVTSATVTDDEEDVDMEVDGAEEEGDPVLQSIEGGEYKGFEGFQGFVDGDEDDEKLLGAVARGEDATTTTPRVKAE